MALNLSRRHWMALASLGMGGLLAGERKAAAQPVTTARALADPRAAMRVTSLETITVNMLSAILVKMNIEAGVIGLDEGTGEGKIEAVVEAIGLLEPYLKGNEPRQPAQH